MENYDTAKMNILKGVNRKLKIKGIKIAIGSIVACILVGLIAYLWLFVKQNPIDVAVFSNVKIEIKMATINELDNRELPYNHLVFNMNRSVVYRNQDFYIENNEDNTSSLYFYMSESYMGKRESEKWQRKYSSDKIVNGDILLYPGSCKVDKINEITKVYYLFYDYNNISEKEFEKAKSKAVLLWEK